MSSPKHVECEHFEERNSKFHNGMLLLAPAYHICISKLLLRIYWSNLEEVWAIFEIFHNLCSYEYILCKFLLKFWICLIMFTYDQLSFAKNLCLFCDASNSHLFWKYIVFNLLKAWHRLKRKHLEILRI